MCVDRIYMRCTSPQSKALDAVLLGACKKNLKFFF